MSATGGAVAAVHCRRANNRASPYTYKVLIVENKQAYNTSAALV